MLCVVFVWSLVYVGCCCFLVVVRCALRVACCTLGVVRCVLLVGRFSLFAVRCACCVPCCVLFVGCWCNVFVVLLIAVRCAVCCLLFAV